MQNRTPGPRIIKIRRSSTHKQATERPGIKTGAIFCVPSMLDSLGVQVPPSNLIKVKD